MRFVHTCLCLSLLSTAGCTVSSASDEAAEAVGETQQAATELDGALCGAPVNGEMVQGAAELIELQVGHESPNTALLGTLEATYSWADLSIAGVFTTQEEKVTVEGELLPSDGPFWDARIRLGRNGPNPVTVHLMFSVKELDMANVTLPRGWVDCSPPEGDVEPCVVGADGTCYTDEETAPSDTQDPDSWDGPTPDPDEPSAPDEERKSASAPEPG